MPKKHLAKCMRAAMDAIEKIEAFEVDMSEEMGDEWGPSYACLRVDVVEPDGDAREMFDTDRARDMIRDRIVEAIGQTKPRLDVRESDRARKRKPARGTTILDVRTIGGLGWEHEFTLYRSGR